MQEWIDRSAALDALGVRAQTLYAYVSRGQIGMRPDPADPRRSLYRAEDIANLKARRHRGRRVATVAASTMAWGEPSIETAISAVRHARLLYRGADAVACAQTATCEEVAAILWESAGPVAFSPPVATKQDPFAELAAQIPGSHPALGRQAERLQLDAARAIAGLACALGAAGSADPLHFRLSRGWGLETRLDESIRMALILVADHELNASTFAVRVAASTGASIPACLLAGLAALSGPRHGGAANAVVALLAEARQTSPRAAIARHLATGQPIPGFGHPLYPTGDPRAATLLRTLLPDPLIAQCMQEAQLLIGTQPNIDFALAALAGQSGFPPAAAFRLFALGRSLGWAAHAMEQSMTGRLIRPRGIYTGRLPVEAPVN